MALETTSVLLDPESILVRAGCRADFKVADLGCGTTGHLILPAARLVGPKGEAIAVDVVESVLNGVAGRARLAGLANLRTVWADCEVPRGVKLPDGYCDIVLVVNNLYQAKSRGAFLAEAARLTKSGGKVVIVDWKTVATPLGPPANTRVTAEAVRPEAERAGLKFLENFEPGPYHWGMIFVK